MGVESICGFVLYLVFYEFLEFLGDRVVFCFGWVGVGLGSLCEKIRF